MCVLPTADIFSSKNKSYWGKTCNFIKEINYVKYSYIILACRHIIGNYVYFNTAKVIYKIMVDLKFENEKATHVTTKNASNFGKAFHTYIFETIYSYWRYAYLCLNYLCLMSSDDGVNNSNLEFEVVDLSLLLLNYIEIITCTISLLCYITCSAYTLKISTIVDTANSKSSL